MAKTWCVIAVCISISCIIKFNDGAVAAGFKYCLYECANCIEFWGDDLYDGEKCATCCRYSNGIKVDPQCKVWVTNKRSYVKKDKEYVNGGLFQRIPTSSRYIRKRWDENVNYNSIFGSEIMPSYCFE
jgi:hypothetical protein